MKDAPLSLLTELVRGAIAGIDEAERAVDNKADAVIKGITTMGLAGAGLMSRREEELEGLCKQGMFTKCLSAWSQLYDGGKLSVEQWLEIARLSTRNSVALGCLICLFQVCDPCYYLLCNAD
eukprot:SAG31_NODE_1144_length_9687_cov_10.800167_2_plen_122_part_00